MKPAYGLDLRDPERALAELLSLLDRAAPRSRSVSTWIPLPQNITTNETSYLPVDSPLDDGTTIRAVRLLPSENYRISRYGPSLRIGVGLRTSDRFEVLGREWNSSIHALTVGTPFDLVTDEQPVSTSQGVVVRVVRTGWPTTWPVNATVETTIGYDPGA